MKISEIQDKSKTGIKIIENSIIELLDDHNGLTNSEIANILGLESSHEGKQKDFLTYSILGNLMKRDLIIKDRTGSRPVYRIRR